MKIIKCENCGSNDFYEKDGYQICNYCESKYALTYEDIMHQETTIEVYEDVKMLLQKCKVDPVNARKYASLVLDIDPSNIDAIKYL